MLQNLGPLNLSFPNQALVNMIKRPTITPYKFLFLAKDVSTLIQQYPGAKGCFQGPGQLVRAYHSITHGIFYHANCFGNFY